ncbi:MAG: glycosyltransferase family 4 protein [Actinomycetota bacterium]
MTEQPSDSRPADDVAKLGDIAAAAGIRRVTMLAWRDLDDPEAGGSEVHAARVAELWARAGIAVTMRTSFAAGHPSTVRRDGYRVVRKAGRYMVFPRAALAEAVGRHGDADALVEIWNGMPFFSPVWSKRPRAVWLHHVHDTMWEMTLPPRLARLGRTVEFRVAPPIYRRAAVVTLSESSRREIESRLRLRDVTVVPPGVDPVFAPGPDPEDPEPLVVAVGRLVPVKRFHVVIAALAGLKVRFPGLRLVIVGEGYERPALEAEVARLDAGDWVEMPGRVAGAELVALYRRAWFVASASAHEGWGMTLTEAAACGTPAVASRISGHADAVVDGSTGLLVDGVDGFADACARLLGDDGLRQRMATQARARAAELTWGATARGTLEVLAAQVTRRRSR